MLKQLARLSVEADGRYATASELQFLKDYFQSVENRISVYEKIRNVEEDIIPRMEAEKRAKDPTLFRLGERDVAERCQRDLKRGLRYAATAMLFNDLDYLRENPLLWYKTIVCAFGFEREMGITYELFQNLMKEYLAPEEAELMMPALQLYRTVLK